MGAEGWGLAAGYEARITQIPNQKMVNKSCVLKLLSCSSEEAVTVSSLPVDEGLKIQGGFALLIEKSENQLSRQ